MGAKEQVRSDSREIGAGDLAYIGGNVAGARG